jgi:O-antigen ligase
LKRSSTRRPIAVDGKPGAPFAHRLIRCGAAIAVLGAAWLVDPFAEASYDAPKRNAVLFGAVLAALASAWVATKPDWRRWSRSARLVAMCLALLVAWMTLATLASPHAELAWPALRRALLFLLLIPVGASAAFDGRGGRALFVAFVVAVGSNALISLLQSAGMELPLDVVQIGGRFMTGALLGNEGYVALACALLGAAGVAIAITGTSRRTRWLGIASVAVAIATIAVNRQATSAIALLAAAFIVVAVRCNARRIAALAFAALALVALSAVVPPLRAVTWAQAPIGVEDYQRLTTWRLGAWVSALDMAASRPWTGYGPGTFGAEQQVHRFAAELALHERFVQPLGASFVHAHEDYLQLAAECGWPALLFALAALSLTMAALVRSHRTPVDVERGVLLAILSTGLIASLAWFPMQIPLTVATLLLATGRAWRLIAVEDRP